MVKNKKSLLDTDLLLLAANLAIISPPNQLSY